jgi:hypothetical protein
MAGRVSDSFDARVRLATLLARGGTSDVAGAYFTHPLQGMTGCGTNDVELTRWVITIIVILVVALGGANRGSGDAHSMASTRVRENL